MAQINALLKYFSVGMNTEIVKVIERTRREQAEIIVKHIAASNQSQSLIQVLSGSLVQVETSRDISHGQPRDPLSQHSRFPAGPPTVSYLSFRSDQQSDQSINQLINQSIRSISQSVNQSISQSIKSISQSVNKSISQSINQ